MWLGEPCSSNPLRIPHPQIDKLACQSKDVGIFAEGEITLRDATVHIYWICLTNHKRYFIIRIATCQEFYSNLF